ncbi:MAG: tRNA (N(6)-L-threonylcarbamoyladenosine(37)-C(2))-methylthiotransferase MtaB [Alphaproteobacteria bacterium]|nr:tRNA (N(6)-L-threonylcarbamoyladenosine(37)-C(2))-methylthiotransferase MtaB [Alphaproteobacteria bacterium]
MNIKTLSFGCRLNALESEKIASKLNTIVDTAIFVNTCAVTAEAERQSAQAVRKIARENPNVVIFVTGCGATRNSELFSSIPHVVVVDNFKKMNIKAYAEALSEANFDIKHPEITCFKNTESTLSKQFVQVQNGCNHDCTYCVTRLLRGKSVSFPYEEILADVKEAIKNGFYEVVLTGVDTASYLRNDNGTPFLLSDLCENLLKDVPELKHLRLSSIDPASPEVPKIIDLMKKDKRFMPHLHLSMQSGSDEILKSMRRRHDSKKLCEIVKDANRDFQTSFSADIICGFPGETEELFEETVDVIKKMGLVHVHAFPFSARPDTEAALMTNQVDRSIAKKRVKIINKLAENNRKEFMQNQIGKVVSVLVEQNNIGRTPDDIDIKIVGENLPNRMICDVKIKDISDGIFVGELA